MQSFIQGDMISITWSATDDNPLPPNPINITYGAAPIWSIISTDESNGGSYLWDTSSAPCPGTYWMNISAYDSIGQTTFDESNFSFAIDCLTDNPPIVEAWEPGGSPMQSFVQGDMINITWNATDDNPLPPNPINITYGSASTWNIISTDEPDDGLYLWDTSSVICPGTYWMNLSVYDSIGQETYDIGNSSFEITCPSDSYPVITVTEPGGASGQIHILGDPITITWTASDDQPLPANPINITYGNLSAGWTPISNDELNDGIYVWDTSSVICPDTYWINISVYDSIGQTTFDLSTFGFNIVCPDTTPPTITNLQPPHTSTTEDDTPTISASYSDPSGINISSVIMTVDGSDVTSSAMITSSEITYTPPSPLSIAQHTIYLEVKDNSANANKGTATWSFTITPTVSDTEPPVANAGEDKSALTSETVVFNGNASHDNVDSLDQLNFTWKVFLNGNLVATLYDVTPSHVLDTAGQYEVNLTVRDKAGNLGYDAMTLTVSQPVAPKKDFLSEYWWVLVLLVIIIVVILIVLIFMRKKKKKDQIVTDQGISTNDDVAKGS
jgi:hypothetical protein